MTALRCVSPLRRDRANTFNEFAKKKGPVKLRANVDTRYYSGTYPYVGGVIPAPTVPGAEEVLSLGHL